MITPQELPRRAFADPASAAGTMRVTEFLTSLPAIGEGKRDRILAELQISPVKRLGGLGARQRRALREFLDSRWPEQQARGGRSRLVVLAGPTAVGKGTVAAYISEHNPEIHLSVSATTRPPRPGEVDGEHYYFVDDAGIRPARRRGRAARARDRAQRITDTALRADPIEEALAAGRTVLLEIDLQGARQVRAAEPSATMVFLLPPSWDELVLRLVGRGTEDDEERARRLRTAKGELAAQNEFDYRVVNDEVASAAREVVELVKAPARSDLSAPVGAAPLSIDIRRTTPGGFAMAGTNQGIIDPPIDSLLEKVDSKYQLVIYASKRARQINDYYSDLHEGNLFDNVGPLVDSTVEDKPLTIALHEIHEDKLRLRSAE